MATEPRLTPDARLNKEIRKLEPRVRRAFLEAISNARRSIDLNDLIDALQRQDLDRAVEILRIRDQVLYPLSESVRSAYIAGGLLAGEKLPITLRTSFGFGSNPRAEEAVQQITGSLIEGIQEDSLAMTRNVIEAGVRDGIPVANLARQITGTGRQREGGYLGLAARDADSIVKGRAKLLSGERTLMREYLRLEQRNKRFDGRIKKAIGEGRKLTVSEVDEIIAAHRTKALGLRGRRIARTETLNATRAGQHEGFSQLAETLGTDRIEVTWKATPDGRTREHHMALGGTSVTFGENFISPETGARLAHPGDVSQGAEAEDIVQCRCAAVYRIKRR